MGLFKRKKEPSRMPDPIPVPDPVPDPVLVPLPPAPPVLLGVNVHALTDAHLATLRMYGISRVRTTLYFSEWAHDDRARADAYAADKTRELDAALAAGLELVVCAHGAPVRYGNHWQNRDRLLADFSDWLVTRAVQWPTVTWQPWNEPHLPSPSDVFGGVPATEAGVRYGEHVMELMARGVPCIAAGVQADIAASFVVGMCAVLDPAIPLALHTYGPPPLAKLRQQLALLPPLEGRALWITEFGQSDADMVRAWSLASMTQRETRQAEDLWAFRNALPAVTPPIARAYGFVLDASDPDGYGLTRADGTWRPALGVFRGGIA